MWKFYKAMAKFYRGVAISAFKEFWTATDDIIAAIAVISFFAILLSRKYGEKLVTAWNGVSPWWSLIPIGLLLIYRLLRANYEKFIALEKNIARQATAGEVKKRIEELTACIIIGTEIIGKCRSTSELIPQKEVLEWATETEKLIQEIFDVTYIVKFRSGVGVPMGMAYWPNLENRNVDGFAHVRVYRLQQFIDELRERLRTSL